MLRLWFTRRWMFATLVALLFAAACFLLGRWQWGRHLEQVTKVAAIDTNYGAAPVPLAAALPGTTITPEQQWRHVTATGTFASGADLLVRNRTIEQRVGFEVVTPFTTREGLTLLVDRGWVPNADDAATTPPVDPPPPGEVTVTGWLRSGEPSLGRDLPHPQLASVSVADARAQRPALGVADVYVVQGTQSPAATPGRHPLTTLPRPDEGLGPHQAYAYQWWLFMPGGIVFVVWAMRRELEPAGGDGAPRPDRPSPTAKPKKVRIWDEEDA